MSFISHAIAKNLSKIAQNINFEGYKYTLVLIIHVLHILTRNDFKNTTSYFILDLIIYTFIRFLRKLTKSGAGGGGSRPIIFIILEK